MKRNWSVLVSN